MTQQLRFLRLASWLGGPKLRRDTAALKQDIAKLVREVDGFCELLGPRNWVYFDFIDHTAVEQILQSESADEAEASLVDHLSDPDVLHGYVRRCRHRRGLRARGVLLERALVDQADGRYYAVVLVLLSVMDGYVNDLNPAHRKGLHARDPRDMVGWNSVVSHHYGLSHAHASFTKRCDKTTEEETFELHRHGIVHGTIVNYDNPIVAAKAWCRLFAVVNWADSLEKQAKEAEKPPTPSLRQVFADLSEHRAKMAAQREGVDAWTARTLGPGDDEFEADAVRSATERYLAAWRTRRFGLMAELLQHNLAEDTPGKTAGMIREEVMEFDLTDFSVDLVAHTAPALADATVSLVVNDEPKAGTLSWVREDSEGWPVPPNVDGAWHISSWGPLAIMAPPRDRPSE